MLYRLICSDFMLGMHAMSLWKLLEPLQSLIFCHVSCKQLTTG